MHSRPRRALVSMGSAAVLSLSVLSGCGFGQATDRQYTPAWGANEQTGSVSALNVAIVASEDGKGSLVGTVANEDQQNDITLNQVQSDDGATTVELAQPLELPAGQTVNLAEQDGGLPVTGEFKVLDSEYVRLTFSFEGAEALEVHAPVIPAKGDFAPHDHGTESSETPSDAGSESAHSH